MVTHLRSKFIALLIRNRFKDLKTYLPGKLTSSIEQQEEAQLVVLEGREEAYRLPLAVAPPPALIQQLKQMATQAGRTLLQLETRSVLHKSIALPAVTEARLESVLGFEMDRHTPFKADDVYFGYRVAKREPATQRILVLHLLIRSYLKSL